MQYQEQMQKSLVLALVSAIRSNAQAHEFTTEDWTEGIAPQEQVQKSLVLAVGEVWFWNTWKSTKYTQQLRLMVSVAVFLVLVQSTAMCKLMNSVRRIEPKELPARSKCKRCYF